MKFSAKILTLFVIAGFAVSSCNDKKPTSSTAPGNPDLSVGQGQTEWNTPMDAWKTFLNANDPSKQTVVYYSFATQSVVTPADPSNSTEWDLAFSYTDIYVNPNLKSVDLTAKGLTKDFVDVVMADVPDTSQFTATTVQYVVDDWYNYNPMTHSLTMTDYVYTLLDAGGQNYAKIRIDSIVGGGAPPAMGTIWFSYVYQPTAGDPDLSGTVMTASLNGSTGTAYFDFSSGAQVTPATPESSMDWDFRIKNYNFEMNNELFGPGKTAAYKVYQDLTDPTDITELTTAPTQPQAYVPDYPSSAFVDWYTYTGPPNHQILSNEAIYSVTDGATYYKVFIASWYTEVNGAPRSANFQIYWEEL